MTLKKTRIHFCWTGGRAIFLDLRRNRYFALPSRLNTAFAVSSGERQIGAMAVDALAQIAAGAVIPDSQFSASDGTSRPVLGEATCDRVTQQAIIPVSTGLILLAWLVGLLAKLLVRLIPLHMLLAQVDRGVKRAARETDCEAMEMIAAAFRNASLFIGSDGNCLPLTLAFVWLCQRFGHNPTFVIGVRINPFSAHCWSQHGDTVLNDACERVRTYQPILVL